MHYYSLGVLAVSWAFWAWDSYLELRQYRVYLKTEKVPDLLKGHIDDQTFRKSKAYCVDKSRFGLLSGFYSQIQTTLTLYYYLIPYFWNLSALIMSSSLGFTPSKSIEWEIFQSIVFSILTSLVSLIINLPISIYSTFVIEERHGFNKQNAAFYAWDKTKGFLVSLTICIPIISAMIYIVRKGGPYFPFYLWLLTSVVVCLLIFFHSEIAAIFDKFTPLPPGQLRDKIKLMAESVKFPLKDIFVVEGSKRSSHSNAYQTGIFKRKKIVIYDTLIEDYHGDDKIDEESQEGQKKDQEKKKKGCNHDEIVAILAHELGHWYHSHVTKNLFFAEINFFIMFLLFSMLHQNQDFFGAFGFNSETPVIIGLILLMMVLTPYNELFGFITTSIVRHFEYQADAYSKSKGYAKSLKTALVKLNIDNLGFPVHDELYSRFNHSHPTLIQRIKALESDPQKIDKKD